MAGNGRLCVANQALQMLREGACDRRRALGDQILLRIKKTQLVSSAE